MVGEVKSSLPQITEEGISPPRLNVDEQRMVRVLELFQQYGKIADEMAEAKKEGNSFKEKALSLLLKETEAELWELLGVENIVQWGYCLSNMKACAILAKYFEPSGDIDAKEIVKKINEESGYRGIVLVIGDDVIELPPASDIPKVVAEALRFADFIMNYPHYVGLTYVPKRVRDIWSALELRPASHETIYLPVVKAVENALKKGIITEEEANHIRHIWPAITKFDEDFLVDHQRTLILIKKRKVRITRAKGFARGRYAVFVPIQKIEAKVLFVEVKKLEKKRTRRYAVKVEPEEASSALVFEKSLIAKKRGRKRKMKKLNTTERR